MSAAHTSTAARERKATREGERRFDIVALGEPMYEFSQVPGKPREYLQGFGGDTMNCAIAAARQGARVAYVTRVGDDVFGRQLLDLWVQEGIDASATKVDAEAHTGVYFISHGPSGHSFSYLRKNSAASKLSPDDLPKNMLASTRFFYTSGITEAISHSARAAAFAAMEIAREAGAQVVFDANVRLSLWSLEQAREAICRSLTQTDLFLVSLEDAQALTGEKSVNAMLEWCAAAGAAVTILKLGAEGVIYHNGSSVRRIRGYKVDAVDATGAGDCFAGALMARLSTGDDLDSSVDYACAAAALTCTGFGAIDPLPRIGQVLTMLRRGRDAD